MDKDVANLRKYTEVYDQGIVNNKKRNEIIIDEVAKHVLSGDTCLIIVRMLQHGSNLIEIMQSKYPAIRAFYAHGETESEDRERIRQALQDRTIDCAITSVIWREGVDIPSLNVVVNAAGSKSEIFCLQSLGRGMRTSKGKDSFILMDFFDNSHHYLVSHFGMRLSLYYDQNWMGV
jgi:superfamily II DNA or RNA helicase